MTTPPGWYPDPGYTGLGPAPERWWDGFGWTEHTREAPGPTSQTFGPPVPVYTPGETGTPARGRGPKIAAAVVVAAVVAAAIVGGIALLGDDDGGSDDRGGAKPGPTATTSAPAPDGSSGGDNGWNSDGGTSGGDDGGGPGGPTDTPTAPAPSDDPSIAEDALNGISLPVLDGWKEGRSSAGGAGITTKDTYPCPNDAKSNCLRGGVFSMPATGFKAKSAEGIAKEDIKQAAESSYGKNPQNGKESYGGITSHKQLKSEAVTVAGQKGYLVRWKVITKKGEDGYVQTVAFPSPLLPDTMVLVRFGFDVSDKAPSLSVMDKIVKGIRALGDSGNGESV
ncbi:DUF2510 domain-containing protein [Streptomyces sp. NBS 14/10]|uniref:DUF2510 domain-containing protein n=1 Tax=Streptomyces sp. NBS 14/10 TaxID=1945643 RepID=UPI000B7EAB01|nr:DUF2510 domain-containing protein [Streptomyces sp. NBS 14/10]KAK1183299.1 DUF2510 domain-containing protein [Streptomyces sp. NBS 14/10]